MNSEMKHTTIHLRRLYLPSKAKASAFKTGLLIELEKEMVHYLTNVLRMKVGDKVRVFDGINGEWLASVEECSRKHGVLELKEQLRPQSERAFKGLIYSPLKKDATEDLIRMGTEMGVTDFYPTIMERTNLRPISDARLQAIVIEACEQSERLDVPIIHAEEKLAERMDSWNDGNIAVAIERSDAQRSSSCHTLMIGPEGGFADTERALLTSSKKTEPISLGDNVLRAPTAACAGLAALNAHKS